LERAGGGKNRAFEQKGREKGINAHKPAICQHATQKEGLIGRNLKNWITGKRSGRKGTIQPVINYMAFNTREGSSNRRVLRKRVTIEGTKECCGKNSS